LCIPEWITPLESWFNFGPMLVICLFSALMSSPSHAHPVAVAEVFRAGHLANYNTLHCKTPIPANSHLEASGLRNSLLMVQSSVTLVVNRPVV
jgi:hypothetical protein